MHCQRKSDGLILLAAPEEQIDYYYLHSVLKRTLEV